MSKLDLSQIPLSDLIVAIQYQIKRHMAEARNVVKILTETFSDKAHVSKVVKEFQERVDWLSDIEGALELAILEASPRFIKEFKERHALLLAAFKETDYVTPVKEPRQQSRGPKKSPNKPCKHCRVSIRPENHTDHEDRCRMNPKNRKDAGTVAKPNRSEDLKPCRYCKRLLGPKNIGRHENLCPKNPKVTCTYDWCRTNTRKETNDYCKRCNALLGIKGKPRGKAGKKKMVKKKVVKKTKSKETPSPHLPSQESKFDKMHRDGVEKKKIKHARYLCENCGHVEMLLYNGEDKIECPKCKANTFDVVAKLDDKGERVEDFEIEEQANALKEE